MPGQLLTSAGGATACLGPCVYCLSLPRCFAFAAALAAFAAALAAAAAAFAAALSANALALAAATAASTAALSSSVWCSGGGWCCCCCMGCAELNCPLSSESSAAVNPHCGAAGGGWCLAGGAVAACAVAAVAGCEAACWPACLLESPGVGGFFGGGLGMWPTPVGTNGLLNCRALGIGKLGLNCEELPGMPCCCQR